MDVEAGHEVEGVLGAEAVERLEGFLVGWGVSGRFVGEGEGKGRTLTRRASEKLMPSI